MLLTPFKISRLKQEKLSVVQRHVLGCMMVWWILLPLMPLLVWQWQLTTNLYVGILGFVVILTWLGISLHLALKPMRKVLLALGQRS